MAEQLTFPLPAHVRLGAEDFFVSPANAAAFEMVTGPAPWPAGKLALIGPEGAGKTHLAGIWARATGGRILSAPALTGALVPPRAGARIVIEDADRLPAAAEESVFHLHNRLAATGGRLLLTGRTAPAHWPVALPDLASRLQAASVIRIGDPDDDLLAAVRMKLFADRQIAPATDVVPFLVRRVERSFAALRRVVDEIDRAALTRPKGVSRDLARSVVERLSAG